jgi:hypothetical protein
MATRIRQLRTRKMKHRKMSKTRRQKGGENNMPRNGRLTLRIPRSNSPQAEKVTLYKETLKNIASKIGETIDSYDQYGPSFYDRYHTQPRSGPQYKYPNYIHQSRTKYLDTADQLYNFARQLNNETDILNKVSKSQALLGRNPLSENDKELYRLYATIVFLGFSLRNAVEEYTKNYEVLNKDEIKSAKKILQTANKMFGSDWYNIKPFVWEDLHKEMDQFDARKTLGQ